MEEPVRMSNTKGLSGSATILQKGERTPNTGPEN